MPVRFALLVCLLVLPGGCASDGDRAKEAEDPGEEDWFDLFDGETLDDWTAKLKGHEVGDNYASTFRPEDGLIEVRYDGYDTFGDRFGHLYYDRPFSHYRLTFEYRFVGETMPDAPDYARLNSGVMFHSQDPRTMPVEQDWPISVEFQLLAEDVPGESRPTGNMCSPGTEVVYEGRLDERHCIESSADTYPKDRWVSAELVVLGDSLVRHVIEGGQVMEYTHPQIGGGVVSGYDPAQKQDGKLLAEGFIALQAEGQEIDFRNVRLLNLKGCMDPEARNYKRYYVASDPATCRD
jgi:hypothetical protein